MATVEAAGAATEILLERRAAILVLDFAGYIFYSMRDGFSTAVQCGCTTILRRKMV